MKKVSKTYRKEHPTYKDLEAQDDGGVVWDVVKWTLIIATASSLFTCGLLFNPLMESLHKSGWLKFLGI